MDVLAYLAAHQGQVVSRQGLERHVWRGALVGYDAVTGTIIKLRKALEDDLRQPRYIAAVPKRGYRAHESPPAASQPGAPEPAPSRAPAPIAQRFRVPWNRCPGCGAMGVQIPWNAQSGRDRATRLGGRCRLMPHQGEPTATRTLQPSR